MDQKHMVSVVMITYNHEKYIAEAIKGVFMQKCDFDIEFIIANDKSTDQTNPKILEFLSKASIPENIKIEYANHEQNKGVSKNFIWSLKKAKGKYIALCEGDDYWTDPLKLQKQVDFLEANPECVLTYHAWRIKNQSNNKISSKINNGSRTLTLLFRTEFSDFKLPKEALNGDMVLKFYLSTKGKFKFLENVKPAIHRHHNGGIWSKKGDYFKLSNKLKTLEEIAHLYENTEYVNKARLNLASIVFSYHKSKQELLDEYIKENSIDSLNSYLNINKIKRLFILQKIKNLLRKFLK
jgi:glycosyltransferase involved in cell wall biosynthesis